MALLTITEYAEVGTFALGSTRIVRGAPLAVEPPVAEQQITFTTATSSAEFNAKTRVLRLLATVDCNILIGTSPEATALNQPLTAGVEYFRALKTTGLKLSVYDGTSE